MVLLRMRGLLSRLAAALTVLLVTAVGASAHPHVWVTMKSEIVFAPDGSAVGVRQSWAFDDMYSAFATQGLEQKKKGEFTREELEPLAKVNVESLKEYDYFTFARADGKKAVFVDPVALTGAPAGCKLELGKPQALTAEMARKLAEIPADGKIPSDSYGAAFANKIVVQYP